MLEPEQTDAARRPANGRSLHIGLNYVDPNHYAGWDGELNACEFDAEDMEQLARSAGFQTNSLIREQATRSAVTSAIRQAASDLVANDIFLITYSGHGGSIPDPSRDEPDGKDETWCLFDGQVIDDEIGEFWTAFKQGVRVLVISDSCHSGSITRRLGRTAAIVSPDDAEMDQSLKPRSMPPAIAARTYRRNRDEYDKLQAELNERGARDVSQRIACTVRLLSGCMDNQYSYDGVANGQFTEQLLRVWANGNFRGRYADFHARILAGMPDNQSPQHNFIGRQNLDYDAQKPFAL